MTVSIPTWNACQPRRQEIAQLEARFFLGLSAAVHPGGSNNWSATEHAEPVIGLAHSVVYRRRLAETEIDRGRPLCSKAGRSVCSDDCPLDSLCWLPHVSIVTFVPGFRLRSGEEVGVE
jgi:hypothetical protein